jgi:hypothetical protein
MPYLIIAGILTGIWWFADVLSVILFKGDAGTECIIGMVFVAILGGL